eukprot:322103-Prymnesium_polylepis.1
MSAWQRVPAQVSSHRVQMQQQNGNHVIELEERLERRGQARAGDARGAIQDGQPVAAAARCRVPAGLPARETGGRGRGRGQGQLQGAEPA